MGMWFEQFDFESDPYERLDPYLIREKYIDWDRPDLQEVRHSLNRFVENVCNQRRVGLKVFGPSGGGKTWFVRLCQKEISKKQPTSIFVYTKIPEIEPTFQVVYRIGIEYFLDSQMTLLIDHVTKTKQSTSLEAWKEIIDDPNLSVCFAKISGGGEAAVSARRWLIGDKLSSAELKSIEIVTSLDSDYDRFVTLKKLLKQLSRIFSTAVLIVDELENASVKPARQLGDSLRDMLDEFGERFALLCCFTAEKEEEWYDLGYTEALARRLDFTVKLDSLKIDTLPEFLRLHHRLYRKRKSEVKDQIFPFTEDGIRELLNQMDPSLHYPGYFLPNCGELARLAALKRLSEINAGFVKSNISLVPHIRLPR